MLYLLPFFTALGGSVLLCTVAIWIAKRSGLGKRSRENARNISRFGGVAVLAAFFISLLADPNLVITRDIVGLLAGAAAIFVFGFLDDVKDISWKWQLLFQIALVVGIITFFGVRIESLSIPFGGDFVFQGALFWIGTLFTCMWFLFLMNAVNWIDGIDGLSPGIMVLAGVVLFSVSLRPEVFQPPVAILAATLAGAYAGLFFFNFPPARIFSGTVGTFFGGFSIAYIAIFAGAKIASAFLVLSIPLLDALWVAWKRFRSGGSVAKPDRRHVQFMLQDRFGWSARRTLATLLSAVFFLALVSMWSGSIGKIIAILAIFGFFIPLLLLHRGEKR